MERGCRAVPMTSAMTRGWRIFERGQWRRRQNTRMMNAYTTSGLCPRLGTDLNREDDQRVGSAVDEGILALQNADWRCSCLYGGRGGGGGRMQRQGGGH